MLTLRALRLPDDCDALLALDTSFTTAQVFRVVTAATTFALQEQTVSPPLSKEYDLNKEIDSFRMLDDVLVAELDGRVVGVAAYHFDKEDRRGTLRHLYVDREQRGKGVGHALMDAMVERAKRDGARCLWLETQDINYTAIQFYKRCGFEWCGLDRSLDEHDGSAADETAVFFMRILEL